MPQLTFQARKTLVESDVVYVEYYTSYYYPLLNEVFEKHVPVKKYVPVTRKMLEDSSGDVLWKSLSNGLRTTLAVIGDPFIATTHVALKNIAVKKGFKVKYVPGINIYSYSISRTGLFNYKFGGSSTIVFPWNNIVSKHPYEVLCENKAHGWHTFFFLDINEKGEPMTATDALKILMNIEGEEKLGVLSPATKIVIIQHAGWPDEKIFYISMKKALKYTGFNPPHSIIIPGSLHYIEEEVLEAFRVER